VANSAEVLYESTVYEGSGLLQMGCGAGPVRFFALRIRSDLFRAVSRCSLVAVDLHGMHLLNQHLLEH
jgi:hypothetical protein